jgi:hypothetical protein
MCGINIHIYAGYDYDTARYVFVKSLVPGILAIINLIGSTSLKTIEVPPVKLHEQLRHENLVKVVDKVVIITEDKKQYQFVVTAISEDEFLGEDVTIAVASIIDMQTQHVNVGKTALLTSGLTGTMILIVIARAPAAILAAGGG